ncbi:glycosyl hydrolase family 18 protein [Alphaproteobacteria bacterium]|nr:glycosyl hydrolase family 18 protein [Alphaproteobacteria bacterium]
MIRQMTVGLIALAATVLPIGPLAAADKVNLTYVEDAPSPIGKLTQTDFDDMAASDFTHFVFAFINFCTPATGGKFTCPGTDPVVVWNINAIDDPDGTAEAMMKGLSKAGKMIYVSIGGAQNDETWAYFASATKAKQATAMGTLSTFMSNYSVTGIDLDFETSSGSGYNNFASAISGNLSPVPPVSIAPYNCSNQPYSELVWQYCNLVGSSKISPTLINRQYYAGGAQCAGWNGPSPQMPAQVEAAIKADLGTFSCQDGSTITVTPAQMNPGLATLSTVGNSRSQANCEASSTGSSMYSGCADIVSTYVGTYPDIAGAAFWQWTSLKDQTTYASEISPALGSDSCFWLSNVTNEWIDSPIPATSKGQCQALDSCQTGGGGQSGGGCYKWTFSVSDPQNQWN